MQPDYNDLHCALCDLPYRLLSRSTKMQKQELTYWSSTRTIRLCWVYPRKERKWETGHFFPLDTQWYVVSITTLTITM